MALNVNDLRNGMVFSDDGQLLQVLTFEHIKMGRGSGNVKVKAKNLKTGSITEKSFINGLTEKTKDWLEEQKKGEKKEKSEKKTEIKKEKTKEK